MHREAHEQNDPEFRCEIGADWVPCGTFPKSRFVQDHPGSRPTHRRHLQSLRSVKRGAVSCLCRKPSSPPWSQRHSPPQTEHSAHVGGPLAGGQSPRRSQHTGPNTGRMERAQHRRLGISTLHPALFDEPTRTRARLGDRGKCGGGASRAAQSWH